MKRIWNICLLIPAVLFTACCTCGCQEAQQHHFETSGHHVLNNGRPFFWLGDTAWLLVKRSPQDVQHYMKNRSSKGFTVVQMMAVRVHHHAPADLLGFNSNSIFECWSTGNVLGIGFGIGGLVGESGSEGTTITGSHATGNVTGTYYVGGLVGSSRSNISQCSSTGEVSGGNEAGGLLGVSIG